MSKRNNGALTTFQHILLYRVHVLGQWRHREHSLHRNDPRQGRVQRVAASGSFEQDDGNFALGQFRVLGEGRIEFDQLGP